MCGYKLGSLNCLRSSIPYYCTAAHLQKTFKTIGREENNNLSVEYCIEWKGRRWLSLCDISEILALLIKNSLFFNVIKCHQKQFYFLAKRNDWAHCSWTSLHYKDGSGLYVRSAKEMNKKLRGWCQGRHFGFFDHGAVYLGPGLLSVRETHLSQRGKRILVQELTGLIERALN